MTIGFIGLGKMGAPMVQRLLRADLQVIVRGKYQEQVDGAVASGAIAADSTTDMLEKFGENNPVVWLMIPSAAVDDQLAELLETMPHGSIIIDGGNSDYRLTLERAKQVENAGITYVDVGTSGGILGSKDGYCFMIGGDAAAVTTLRPIFDAMAATNGWQHVGPTGAGHYVKMVHNAIEYGMMESYAEGYRLLKEGPIKDIKLADAGEVWQHGSIIDSGLNKLSADILRINPDLDGIDGYVAETGEARWALEVGAANNIDMPSIAAAFAVRKASANGEISFATKLLAAQRNAFGGHMLNKEKL